MQKLLSFQLAGERHAVPLEAVERVVHAVAVTPLPGAPPDVLGVIDVAGEVVPVFSLHVRFGLPSRALSLGDQFVLVRFGARRGALVVDAVEAVVEVDTRQQIVLDHLVPGLPTCGGVVRLEDGLIVIHDLARFLSVEDEARLAHALERR